MKPAYRISGLLLAVSLLLAGCSSLGQQGSRHPVQSLNRISLEAPERRNMTIHNWHTDAGTRVLFFQSDALPMLDLRLTFAAGSSRDDQQPGLAWLTNNLIDQGNQQHNTDQIAQGFEQLGAQLGNGSYRDMAVLSLRTLSADEFSRPAIQLFTEVLAAPSFPASALNRSKNQLLAALEQQKQNPGQIANQTLYANLYGTHPYAHPGTGNEQSITRLQRQDLNRFYRKYYSAGNATLALVGNLNLQDARQIAEQISQALPQGSAASPIAAPAQPVASHQHIEFAATQTHILLAQLGIKRGDPDYPALFIGNQILGGSGFGSRLMEEVREKRGLTYGISSFFSPMQARGPFIISVQTRAELSEATLDLVRQLLTEYVAQGPSQAELDAAKLEFMGSFPLSAASNADIVGQLGAIGFYDLPLDWLESLMQEVRQLSLEQVTSALQRHLQPDQIIAVTVGPTVEQQPLPAAVERNSQPEGRQH